MNNKQIKKLNIDFKNNLYYIVVILEPTEDSDFQTFCEQAVEKYTKSYVIKDIEEYEKLFDKFIDNLFITSEHSEYSTINPKYIEEKNKYFVHGYVLNQYDYCITQNEDEENIYVFSEVFENNPIVRSCIEQLEKWFQDETDMFDNDIIRLICSLSYHWD